MNNRIIQVPDLTGLEQAAAEVLDFAKNEKILLFEGEMAAGKTTLIKEICRQCEVAEPATSPTYALVNEYRSKNGKEIYHFDFYRITQVTEALDMGVVEYFDSGNMCLIEWPSRIGAILPEHAVEITIEKGTGEARTITLKRI